MHIKLGAQTPNTHMQTTDGLLHTVILECLCACRDDKRLSFLIYWGYSMLKSTTSLKPHVKKKKISNLFSFLKKISCCEGTVDFRLYNPTIKVIIIFFLPLQAHTNHLLESMRGALSSEDSKVHVFFAHTIAAKPGFFFFFFLFLLFIPKNVLQQFLISKYTF